MDGQTNFVLAGENTTPKLQTTEPCSQQDTRCSLPGQPRPYLGFLHDLDEEHVVLHGVDDDEHVPEVGGDDAPAVVARVLRPHDVNLVVPQVPELQQQIGSLLIRAITALHRGSRLAN